MCYQWVEEMISSKEDVLLPAKISMKPNDKVFCNVMPCMLGHKKDFLTYTWGGGEK